MIKDEAFKKWLDASGVSYREDVAWGAWQAAKEASRKELEATKRSEKEGWRYADELEQDRKRLSAEKEALEKKLADAETDALSAYVNGYGAGKRAGRDEYQKEMSEQEPVAYDIQYSCEQVSPYITRTITHSDDFSSVKNTFGFEVNIISKDELILRPQPPKRSE